VKLNAKGIVGTTDNWLTYRYILTGQGLSLEGKNQRIKIDITTNDSSNQHPFSIKQGNGNGSYNNEVFYVDRNGNVVAENATIRVNRAGITNEGSNDNSIRIWAGETYENRNSAPFRVTQGGKVTASEAEIHGTFATGEEGNARTIISENGIQSYNSSNQKHGLWCNSSESQQRFSDLILYYNGNPIFAVENGVSNINLYAFGNRFLSAYDKTVDFTSANTIKINNVNGTFTTADGKIITIQNGVVTNIS